MNPAWKALPFKRAIVDVSAGNTKLQTDQYLPHGKYPIVDQGQALIAGYSDDPIALARITGPTIVFGDHTRIFKYVDFPFCIGADGTRLLKPIDEIDPKYAFYFLSSIKIPSAGYSRHFKYLKRVQISFPPLDEQRRIAAILDQADNLRRKRREAIGHLGILSEALFSELFGDVVANNRGWRLEPLSSTIKNFEGGKNIVADGNGSQNPIRVLKISAIQEAEFNEHESKALPDGYEPPGQHFVQCGDLLLSRANTTERVGLVSLVEHDVDGLALPDKILRFIWKDRSTASPRYWLYCFRSRPVRGLIGRLATGTSGSMKNISQEKLLSMKLSLPPWDLQRAFADRVAEIDKLKAHHRAHLAKLDALFASLQHRAFRGEL